MLSPKDPINFYIFLSPNAKFHSPNEKNRALTKWPLIFRPIRPHIFGFFSHRMPKIMLSPNDPSFFEPVLSPNAPACRSAGLTPVSISNMTAPPGPFYKHNKIIRWLCAPWKCERAARNGLCEYVNESFWTLKLIRWFHQEQYKFQNTQDGHSVWIFCLMKRQNGQCMLEILDDFSLIGIIVLMYRHSKSAFLQVTLNFELEYMNEY